jgi:hypothetical protein
MTGGFMWPIDFGVQTTVGDAPVGLLVLMDGTVICKSEYRLPSGACECVIVDGGETFHGEGDSARCLPFVLARFSPWGGREEVQS